MENSKIGAINRDFYSIGIAARTDNAKEMSGEGVIGDQWERVMAGGIIEQIPNRADANILAMYTNYESNANGEYAIPHRRKSNVSRFDSRRNALLSKFQTLVMPDLPLQKKARLGKWFLKLYGKSFGQKPRL